MSRLTICTGGGGGRAETSGIRTSKLFGAGTSGWSAGGIPGLTAAGVKAGAAVDARRLERDRSGMRREVEGGIMFVESRSLSVIVSKFQR